MVDDGACHLISNNKSKEYHQEKKREEDQMKWLAMEGQTCKMIVTWKTDNVKLS